MGYSFFVAVVSRLLYCAIAGFWARSHKNDKKTAEWLAFLFSLI